MTALFLVPGLGVLLLLGPPPVVPAVPGIPGIPAVSAAPDVPAATADPAGTEQAQHHFKLGVRLYQERDFPGALAEFRRAHQMVPSFKILFNLGQVSQELHDWAQALRYFREYLQEGGGNIPEARRAEVEQRTGELTTRIAHLSVAIEGGPAQVTLDDEPVSPSGGGTSDGLRTVNPGRRRISVTYPGQPPVVRVVEIASGDQLDLRFAPPVPEPDRRSPPVVLQTARPAGRTLRPVAWVTWTATGLASAAAVTTGLLARQESQTLARERAAFPADPAQLAWRQRRVQSYARSTDALLIGGVALGLVSLYLTTWTF